MKKILVIFILIISICNAGYSQLLSAKMDGFYRLTYHYQPNDWKLYNFIISPFSPVYSTEVSVPETSYIKIEISSQISDSNTSVINSFLSNEHINYLPAVYNINWIGTTDKYQLPVVDGNYVLSFFAFKDSTHQKIIFVDSIQIPVRNGWKDIGVELINDVSHQLPGYIVYMDTEVTLLKEKETKDVEYKILGARFKEDTDSNTENHLLAISMKFGLNEYENTFTTIYSAEKSQNSVSSYHIINKLGFYKLEIVDITIRYKDIKFLVVDALGSGLVIIDINKLWKKLLD
jgi:hypothetical protein